MSNIETHEVFDYNPPNTITECFWIVPKNDKITGQAIHLKNVPEDYVLVRKNELEKLTAEPITDVVETVKLGFGNCPNCEWYLVVEGCNVERDSTICKLNRKENIDNITVQSLFEDELDETRRQVLEDENEQIRH